MYKRQRLAIPVIMLSARCNSYDRVIGLENGADDYLSKPFEPRELVARIHTVLRRTTQPQGGGADVLRSDVIHFDGWVLHREERTLVSPAGLAVALSNAEFRLLSTFLQTPRRLFSRDQLVEQARGRSMDVFERSIDLMVSRLRQKLADDTNAPSVSYTHLDVYKRQAVELALLTLSLTLSLALSLALTNSFRAPARRSSSDTVPSLLVSSAS